MQQIKTILKLYRHTSWSKTQIPTIFKLCQSRPHNRSCVLIPALHVMDTYAPPDTFNAPVNSVIELVIVNPPATDMFDDRQVRHLKVDARKTACPRIRTVVRRRHAHLVGPCIAATTRPWMNRSS